MISRNLKNLRTGIEVRSSAGEYTITTKSGSVIQFTPTDEEEKPKVKIKNFDLGEWRRYHKAKKIPKSIDILDLGYWYEDVSGVLHYEEPDGEWRKLMIELQEENDSPVVKFTLYGLDLYGDSVEIEFTANKVSAAVSEAWADHIPYLQQNKRMFKTRHEHYQSFNTTAVLQACSDLGFLLKKDGGMDWNAFQALYKFGFTF